MNAYYIIYVHKIVNLKKSVDWYLVNMLFAENAYTYAELFPFDQWICIYNK